MLYEKYKEQLTKKAYYAMPYPGYAPQQPSGPSKGSEFMKNVGRIAAVGAASRGVSRALKWAKPRWENTVKPRLKSGANWAEGVAKNVGTVVSNKAAKAAKAPAPVPAKSNYNFSPY